MTGNEKPENEWYVTAFSRLYPILYAHRSDSLAQDEVEGLCRTLGLIDRGARILDACCGAGRHAAVFAELGFHVLGFDLSPVLIERAVQRDALSGRLVRADMRHIPFGQAFDVILNLFTSFGYFENDDENEQVLDELVRMLNPGGHLVIDHIHKARLERTLVPHDEGKVNGHTFIQKRRFEGKRVVKEIDATLDTGERLHLVESVRTYSPEEMETTLRAKGFEEIRLLGNFSGEPLAPDSDRMIIVARKGGE